MRQLGPISGDLACPVKNIEDMERSELKCGTLYRSTQIYKILTYSFGQICTTIKISLI